MAERTFGEIPEVAVGTTFPDREALAAAAVHRPTQAGISGSTAEGADSIVVSGGYEDDRNLGDEIIYTGAELAKVYRLRETGRESKFAPSPGRM
jgi:putative restriction endonuclease